MSQKKRVLLGLSGGVDSAVAGYLLLQQGYEVIAGFMKNYTSDEDNCPTRKDRDAAIEAAQHLGIQTFVIFDFREEYNKKVVQYIYDGYQAGITPNPDILCNSEIKFKLFLEKGIELGCDFVATGHYARIQSSDDGMYSLLKGLDPAKDQSYFLSGLNQYQLSKSLFPLGEMHKTEVRALAEKINLPNARRPDSQGICFVGKVDMHTFLQKKIPTKIGNIVDTKGHILGQHEGAWYFTIGQRKGIKIGGGPALFVVHKDIVKNEIIVGTTEEQELYGKRLILANWQWIGKGYTLPLACQVKIRYRQEDQGAELYQNQDGQYMIAFDQSQRAITSGQSAVAYIGDELIGSGIIL